MYTQVTVLEAEFLKNDGDPQWLKGLQYVPTKVVSLLTINKMLAHQPWFVKPTHMKVSNDITHHCDFREVKSPMVTGHM